MTISVVEHQRGTALGLRDAVASCCSSPLFTCPVRAVCGREERTRNVERDGDTEAIMCQMNRERKRRGQVKNSLQSSNILHSVREKEGVPQACMQIQIHHLN